MNVAVLLAVLFFTVLGIVVAVVVGRRLASRWNEGTGREDWLAAARGLTWRQRWAIVWAQTLSRPVRYLELVEAAQVRARYAIAAGERMQQPGSPLGRLRWLFVALAVLQIVLGILNVSLGSRAGWMTIAAGVILLGTWLWTPRAQASEHKRIQRSLDGTLSIPRQTA